MLSLLPGTVVNDRYRVDRPIGRGSFGSVYVAEDLAAEVAVAIKFVAPASWVELRRTLREIASLRALRLPGVVALLDDGVYLDHHYLVMEFAEGEPFPGAATPLPWSVLAPIATRLVAAVARVHVAGFVHRDLKPQNVLVRPDGWVTLLDFGLARRPGGDLITNPGAVAGTPDYVAPEILDGVPASSKSDLFSLGVMLYEAASGVLPWTGRTTLELLRARAFDDPRPLHQLAPTLPLDVERLVHRLLAREPKGRPGSAAEVLLTLEGHRGPPMRELPRLGGTRVLDALVDAAESARPVDLHADPGGGRTRLFADVDLRVRAAGGLTRWVGPGTRPFESLVPVVGSLDPLRSATLAEARAWVTERVTGLLRAGGVLFVDTPEAVDRWSGQVLQEARPAGALLRAVPGPGELTLRPLDEADLRPLFEGPERILHLPTDAAAELWLRTGGVPARVHAEVVAWVAAGLASWRGARLVVGRDALARLRSGLGRDLALGADAGVVGLAEDLELVSGFVGLVRPAVRPEVVATASGLGAWEVEALVERLEAMRLLNRLGDGRVRDTSGSAAANRWGPERRARAARELAAALEPGEDGRLHCLLVGEELAEAGQEAVLVAVRATRLGRLGSALSTLETALALGREELGPEVSRALLEAYVVAGLGTESARVLRKVAYELPRAGAPHGDLVALVQAAIEAREGDASVALGRAEAMAPFTTGELELARQAVRVRAALRAGRAAEDRVVAEVQAWAETCGIPGAAARADGWLGNLRFRQGRWAEAAACHLRAHDGEPWEAGRIAELLHAASALLEAGSFDEAERCARRAHEAAAECRHAVHEARAEWLLRAMAYRRGESSEPDLELCDAVAALMAPDLEGLVVLGEAAFAWRAGAPGARELALRAAGAFGSVGMTLAECLARALAVAAGERPALDGLAILEIAARRCGQPILGVQILGLLGDVRDNASDAATLAGQVPREQWALCRELLSVRDALAMAGVTLT